ncbi:MAG: WXG100 family type VII secretion target [Lachnospiraceae bacterium]|nr:WXG100 family type VII secretion target [Lachnospiraceae bacterium]
MANTIAVNTIKLGNDASYVGNYIKNIENKISDMQVSVKELDALWDGPSSEAFKAAFQQDIQAMTEMIKGLKDVKSYEDNAKTKYEACERRVSELISEIKI